MVAFSSGLLRFCDPEGVFQLAPALQDGGWIIAEQELAEVELDAWARVNFKPMEGACCMASSTERECLGKVVTGPGNWGHAHASR